MTRTPIRASAAVLALAAVGGLIGATLASATEAPDLHPFTAVYGYTPIDPTLNPGTGNSGPQDMAGAPIAGHVDHRTVDLTGVDACAAQIDHVLAVSADAIPRHLPGAYGIEVPGQVEFVRGWHHVANADACVTPEPEPTPEPIPEAPPVEAPPAADTPSPQTPVTPEAPKDLSGLSPDEAAQVQTFARAHGIPAEAVLVEMG